MNKRSNYAVIPAYEPDERLITLADEARQNGFEVLIVDDGSGEQYRRIFAEAARSASVLSYPENRGKGRAMKEAFSILQPNIPKNSVIVILDCDGQHTVADALRLCDQVCETPDTVILGSRKQSRRSPMRSRLGNAVTRGVFRLVSVTKVYDTQTGMRAFSASLLPELLSVPGERYEYEMNMLLQLAEHGIPMREAEIETIYIDHNAGSHFHPLRDSWRIYKEILKFSGSSLLSFGLDYLLYSLIVLIAGSGAALAANIGARTVSAAANYELNRRFVFRDNRSVGRTAPQYFALAAVILLSNTVLLWSLTEKLGINAFIAKLFAELILFTISYLVQKRIIFRRRPVAAGSRAAG